MSVISTTLIIAHIDRRDTKEEQELRLEAILWVFRFVCLLFSAIGPFLSRSFITIEDIFGSVCVSPRALKNKPSRGITGKEKSQELRS
jgi:hypothetical protein